MSTPEKVREASDRLRQHYEAAEAAKAKAEEAQSVYIEILGECVDLAKQMEREQEAYLATLRGPNRVEYRRERGTMQFEVVP